MKFNCIEISINDEGLGCQVEFSEKKDLDDANSNMSIQEIMKSTGRYLLFQRSYPEDEFDRDFIYFETHDSEFAGELTDYEMVLSKQSFELKLQGENIVVLINPTENEYFKLKDILQIITNHNDKLSIVD